MARQATTKRSRKYQIEITNTLYNADVEIEQALQAIEEMEAILASLPKSINYDDDVTFELPENNGELRF